MTTSDQLEATAQLLEKGWTQGGSGATDARGMSCSYRDPQATHLCLDAALCHVFGNSTDKYFEARNIVRSVVGGNNVGFNDAPDRTQSEVVAAVREAARLAREQEA